MLNKMMQQSKIDKDVISNKLNTITDNQFLDSTKTALIIIDENGGIAQSNPFFREIFCTVSKIENISEIKFSNFFGSCDENSCWCEKIITNRDFTFPKVEFKKEDGFIYFTIMSVKMDDKEENRSKYIVTLTDITKVVEMHKNELSLSKELAYKQGIFDVTSEYIHNIGNIITGAKHQVGNLAKNLSPIQNLTPYFKKLKDEADKLHILLSPEDRADGERTLKAINMGLTIIESSLNDIIKNTLNENVAKLTTAIDNISQTISYQQEIYKQTNTQTLKNDDVDINSLIKDIRDICDDNMKKEEVIFNVSIEKDFKINFSKVNLFNGILNLLTNSIYAVKKAYNDGVTTSKEVNLK
ncbi:MAG: hypothetical protein HXX81_05815, partial [Campylobacterales bacterium]|nr:hypothetical protein [Campylobacterales bacterium]